MYVIFMFQNIDIKSKPHLMSILNKKVISSQNNNDYFCCCLFPRVKIV